MNSRAKYVSLIKNNLENPYSNILPFVVIVLLAVLGAHLINQNIIKKEEAFLPEYKKFEGKFRQISSGNTDDDVTRILGPPASVYQVENLLLRGPEKQWEYKMVNRTYTVSFNENEPPGEKPLWRVYSTLIHNPTDAGKLEVDGYMRIVKLTIIFTLIFFGFKGIKAIYRHKLQKRRIPREGSESFKETSDQSRDRQA